MGLGSGDEDDDGEGDEPDGELFPGIECVRDKEENEEYERECPHAEKKLVARAFKELVARNIIPFANAKIIYIC